MSETSRRRRWFGNSLLGASALALPLTASISYAAANAQAPTPASPPPAIVAVDPDLPEAPVAAQAPTGPGLVERRVGPDGKHTVRELSWGAPAWRGPQPPQAWPQFHWQGDGDSEEFQREMEQFQREMEEFRAQWAEQYGQDWEKWAEQYGEQWRRWGEQQRAQSLARAERHREKAERQREQALGRAERQRAQALARAERQREQAQTQAWAAVAAAPEVIVSCESADDPPARAERTEDGRQRIVLCNRNITRFARSSLRNARNSIASNPEISEEVRREVLQELDHEIERIEREEG